MSDQLPNGWTSSCVGELGEVRSGVGFPKEHQGRGAGDFPFAKVSDISKVFRNGGTEIAAAAHYVDTNELTKLRATVFPIGTIAFPKIGEALKLNYRVLTQIEMLFDNNVMGLIPVREVCEPRYLLQFLRTIDIAPLSVATAVPSVRGSDIAQIRVPLPPLNEQRRIVAKIEALMARSARAREALDAIPALLDRYRQSVLAAAFRGDLTADWREQNPDVEPASELLEEISKERQARLLGSMGRRRKRKADDGFLSASAPPEIPGYELPNGWALARLTDLSWQSSYGISSKCDYNFPGPPVLRIPNVANGRLLLDDLKRAGEEGFDDADSVDLGDLLVVRTNGSRSLIGRGVVITQPLSEATYFASYLIRFRLLGGIDMARWLATLWHSPQVRAQVYEHAATSAGQYNVSLSELSGFAIPIPPVDELRLIYRRVEAALTSIDLVTDEVRAGTERSAVLDQSILAKAFRGELVPQDPNDEPASALLTRIKAERAAKPPQRVRGRRRKAQEETDDMPLFPGSSSENPLADILNSNSGTMKPEALWEASGLSIDDFYKQLKREVEGGVIHEDKDKQLLLTST